MISWHCVERSAHRTHMLNRVNNEPHFYQSTQQVTLAVTGAPSQAHYVTAFDRVGSVFTGGVSQHLGFPTVMLFAVLQPLLGCIGCYANFYVKLGTSWASLFPVMLCYEYAKGDEEIHILKLYLSVLYLITCYEEDRVSQLPFADVKVRCIYY